MHRKLLIFLVLNLSLCLFGVELTSRDVLTVVKALMSAHVSKPLLTSQYFQKAMEAYIQYWDPERILIMKEEIPNMLKDLEKIRVSNWTDYSPLYKLHDFLINRRKYLEDLSVRKLNEHYWLNPDSEIETNPKLTRFPSLDEIEHRIRDYLDFEVASSLGVGLSLEDAKLAIQRNLKKRTERLQKLATGEILKAFINSFASTLDPHSAYLSEKEYSDLQNTMSLSVEGIGVGLQKWGGAFLIRSVLKGGGAEASGILKPNDLVIGFRNPEGKVIPAAELSFAEAVNMLRGKAGTRISLLIQRNGDSNTTFETEVERKRIELEAAHASIRFEEREVDGVSRKVGIIDIPSFYGSPTPGKPSLTTDMIRLLKEAEAKKIEGLIIDLSKNFGGCIHEALETAGLFIGNKPGLVVKTNGPDKIYSAKAMGTIYDGPLMVLTSPVSASSSEILAGLLKDYSRAVIIGGKQTFGKGTTQTIDDSFDYPGALKVTTGMYFLPKGQTTQFIGVPSDIVIPNPNPKDGNWGEAHRENALFPKKGEAFFPPTYKSMPDLHPDPELISRLSFLSAERVKSNSHLQKLTELAKTAENRPTRMKLSEFLASSTSTKSAAATLDNVEPKSSPRVEEAVNVLIDWIKPLPQERCMNAWRKIGS